MVDRTLWNRAPEHVLEAQGMGSKLDVVVRDAPLAPVLELNRKDGALRVKLHQIRLTDGPKPFRPKGQ